ncbi:hypothetical protein ACHAXR_003720 [Thalassiosira sp. AJA248-18]
MKLPNQAQLAISSGRDINQRGRMYKNGAAYSMDLKLEVANAYQLAQRESSNGRPTLAHIASQFKVTISFVKKIEDELLCHGRVLPPKEIRANREGPVGPGSRSLCRYEFYIIMMLYWEDPRRHLRNYRDWICILTGNVVSKNTISRVILYGFPHKGNMVKPNLVPLDKFRPDNQVKAYDYLKVLFTLSPDKVIFADEKHLRGEELFSQKVRRDPTSGYVPIILTDSDFRNKHHITGFCSINKRKVKPVWFRIHDGINNAEEFYETCLRAGQDGFFEPSDVLVLDGATVHNGVADMMWQVFHVHVLFLPARTCEWNPKELVWNVLVQRMANLPLTAIAQIRKDYDNGGSIVAKAAAHNLDNMTFDEVLKHFAHCYEFFPHWRDLRNRVVSERNRQH